MDLHIFAVYLRKRNYFILRQCSDTLRKRNTKRVVAWSWKPLHGKADVLSSRVTWWVQRGRPRSASRSVGSSCLPTPHLLQCRHTLVSPLCAVVPARRKSKYFTQRGAPGMGAILMVQEHAHLHLPAVNRQPREVLLGLQSFPMFIVALSITTNRNNIML